MKIELIRIHNFRSVLDSEDINLEGLSLLVGPNNVGKSNVIAALNMLYDKEKFDAKQDFPKSILGPEDDESWIDVQFKLTADEYETLPEYTKWLPNKLRIRKYFKSSNAERVKANQSNIYAYESDGVISETLFHGAKNVSDAKIGKVIYIPSVGKVEDILKMSGPSPLREIATFVFEKVAKKSPAFDALEVAFKSFNKDFTLESSSDGYSLKNLVEDINKHLEEWQVLFGINIEKLEVDDIIKNLFTHHFKDRQLDNEPIKISQYGQGFQRHIIYTLIKLSAKYIEKRMPKKKEFIPDFTLILFEEPEAFLHPAQQEVLSASLRSLIAESEETVQMILSTHSPIFVSRNINDLSSLIRLRRENGKTIFRQISDADETVLFGDNIQLLSYLKSKLIDPATPNDTKREIQKLDDGTDDSLKLAEESINYFLWLNPERCALFFADFVIICEGSSEKLLFEHLIQTRWEDIWKKRIYFLDAQGKYNIHRYMNLLKSLGIVHSVIFDSDGEEKHHKFVNDFIENNKNAETRKIEKFSPDFEGFLGIPKPRSNKSYKKPLNVFACLHRGDITEEKIQEIKSLIESLFI